jgi:hypothetical protein
MKTARQRYLSRNGVVGPWLIDGKIRDDYSAAVVIPACDEEEWLFRTLASLAENPLKYLNQTLVLVVLNQSAQSSAAVSAANQRTLQKLKASSLNANLQLAWIDAVSPGLELPVGGAGPARRLGLDRALERLDREIDPTLICLDADTLVEPNYLDTLHRHFLSSPAGGVVLPFEHQRAESPELQGAIDFYELFLRSYVLGLKLAGSPYAFHSIGSAMACRASAYAAAGGMSQRPAGEDFYFLQNLAKTVGVESLHGTSVYPSARVSDRVLFGTGPALGRLLVDPGGQLFYPLEAFLLLGEFLHLATSEVLVGEDLQLQADRLQPVLGAFLQEQKLAIVIDRLRRNYLNQKQFVRAFHGWFDGLKSLRLLRRLCAGAPFAMGTAEEFVPEMLYRGHLAQEADLVLMLEILRNSQNNGELPDKGLSRTAAFM